MPIADLSPVVGELCGCGPEAYECHTDLCLRIELNQPAAYVYPPASLPPEGDLGRYDKVVTGIIHVEANSETKIGPVKVAWEVWHTPKKGKGEVLARYEAVVREGDSVVPEGPSKIPFALTVTHLLPSYAATPFGTTLNRVFASILEPVPDYTVSSTRGSLDGHDQAVAVSPSPRGSVAEYRRRSSRQNGSPAGSSLFVDGHESPRPLTPDTEDEEARKGGLVARLRVSQRPKPKARNIDYDTIEVPATFALRTKFARAWRLDLLPLPPSLQPSMASTDTACGVISCPDRPGEMPSMDWVKSMRIKGLGKVDISLYSAYFACGSGVDMQIDLSDLNPLVTVQSIQLSIAELTVAGTGCEHPGERDEIWYTMLSMGNTDPHANSEGKKQQEPDEPWVWRGGVPASYDRLATCSTSSARSTSGFLSKAKWKKKETQPEIDSIGPPAYHTAVVDTATDESFTLRQQCRLPSPIVGIHASSAVLLDPRISRVSHRLRLDVLFSVLGQDEFDNPLPTPSKPARPGPPEGTVRRLWVEHAVALRVCMLTPDSTIIPPYHSLSESTESLTDYLARIEIRQKPSSFTVPNSRGGRLDTGDGSNDLKERTEEHIDDCQARCLCFYGDNAIFNLIAKKEEGAVATDLEEDTGTKAVYNQRLPGQG